MSASLVLPGLWHNAMWMGTGDLLIVGTIIGVAIFVAPSLLMGDPVGISGEDGFNAAYDYIVVGAGSAGCVIASRLSEDPRVSVLLVEAGGRGSNINYVPGAVGLFYGTQTDWNYKSEADGRSCLGLKKGQCPWHRGKVLGGSSTVNGMMYVRGNRRDYDRWAEMGNYGWSYDEVLPYFLKSQYQTNPRVLHSSAGYHATGGPLPVSNFPYHTKLAEAYLEAASSLGFRTAIDINGEDQFAFTFPQVTMRHGSRFSSARAFLRNARKRPNLHVVLNARVHRIVLKNGYTATGVTFKKDGRKYTIDAKREVILSAGAVESPKLLMLSGIGPRWELERHGIPVYRDLPVGQFVQSHVGQSGIVFSLKEGGVGYDALGALASPVNWLTYSTRGKGPLTAHGFEGVGFVRTGVDYNNTWPDVQMYLVSLHVASDGGLAYRNAENLSDKQYSQFSSLNFKPGFTLIPMLLHPRSTGTITLRSRNPEDAPVLRGNYFDDPHDVRTLVEATKLALKIGQTGAFAQYGAQFFAKPSPFCGHFKYFTDEYWECVIRHHTWPSYHDSGSCRMGPSYDPWAVVDPELRVHGVSNLRVADASIMPEITSGNLNAPCIMIGEKAADLIKGAHGDVSSAQYDYSNHVFYG